MLRKYITKHRFFLLFTGIFLIKFIIFPEFAFADTETGISQERSKQIVNILNGVLTLAATVLGLLTSFITIFIYPGWVNGTLFGLQEYLKDIWILVSNVVYFIFAFIIIVIAFMNIIGKGEGNWELKQAMPRFIIGVLIVPFSWFFVQFILAISAVLTVGVLTLPYDSFKENALLNESLQDSKLGETEICTDVIIYFSNDRPPGSADITTNGNNVLSENIVCESESSLVNIKDFFSVEGDGVNNTIFGVISLYTYGILEVQSLDTIDQSNLAFVKGVADLIFKILFDLLFVVIYMLLMIALFLALLTRGIRLWIYAMLSPTFGLLYFFKSEGMGEGDNKFSIKEFISLAMVPVYVAAALSFGLIFILVAGQGINKNVTPDNYDKIEAGGFSLQIEGALGGKEATVENSVIGKLIVQLFGVVILWIAVMAALRQSEVTKQITQPIADFGKSVGDLAKKAPTYAPIIPTGGGAGSAMSVSGLASAGSRLEGFVRGEAQNRGTDFANRTLGQGDGGDYTKLVKHLNTVDRTQRENGSALKESLSIMGANIATPGAERNRMIGEINEKLNLDIDLGNERNLDVIAKRIHDAIVEAGIKPADSDLQSAAKIRNFLEGNSTSTPSGNNTDDDTIKPGTPSDININQQIKVSEAFDSTTGNINQSYVDSLARRIGTSSISDSDDGKNVLRDAISGNNDGLDQTQIDELVSALIKFKNNSTV